VKGEEKKKENILGQVYSKRKGRAIPLGRGEGFK